MSIMVSRRLYAGIVVGAVAALVAVLGWGLASFGTSALATRPPAAVAQQVGAHYGDPHPRILTLTSTTTDNPPHDPMYLMTLRGRFRYRHRRARFVCGGSWRSMRTPSGPSSPSPAAAWACSTPRRG